MNMFLTNSAYSGLLVSVVSYFLGMALKKRFRYSPLNPLLLASIVTIAYLVIFRIDYAAYQSSTAVLSYMLTPATVCLAVPLYKNLVILKQNGKAILCGIGAGILTNLLFIMILGIIFRLTRVQMITLIPKSITTAIGMSVSNELGGIVSITVATIVITGIAANIMAEAVFKQFGIEEPVAKGIALGTSGHSIGTAKALEIGSLEGAMSGLALAVTGLISVVVISIIANTPLLGV